MTQAAMDGPLVFDSLAQLQRAFRVSYTTAQEWKRRGMPAQADGKFCLPDVLQWVEERRESGGCGTSTDTKKRREQLALQIEEIELRRKTLKLRQEMSVLVDREAALRAKREQDAMVRAMLESIPGRLARVFPPEYRDALVAELEQQVCRTREALQQTWRGRLGALPGNEWRLDF